MSAPALREVQELFWRLLAAPEGVRKGIAGLEAEGEPAGRRLEEWFAGDDRFDAAGRLDVYANMYFFRIRDAVAEDYPALVALLGEAGWHNLMTDYLLAHPSAHWSLRYAGSHIPEFLEAHPRAGGRPDLADLARLERALADVFQQENVPPFPVAELAAAPPERWPALRFERAPSARLLDLAWGVAPLRAALVESRDAEVPEPICRPAPVLVWREDDEERYEEPTPRDAAGLRALLAGEPFGTVCDEMAAAGAASGGVAAGDGVAAEAAEAAEAAGAAAALLADALARGLLRGFLAGSPP